jgi:hypothetical protein
MTITYAPRRLSNAVPQLQNYLGPFLGAASLIFWFLAVHDAVYSRMNGYGLVSLLGWAYFTGLIALVGGFVFEVLRTHSRSGWVIVLIGIFVLYMFGTACAIEPVAELSDSWIIAGFSQYFLVHGHTLNGYDARFSWPGMFSLTAIFVSFVGKANAIVFIRWFPFFIELCYLAPLIVIARFSGASRRAGWLGIAIYYCSNWIFQDYFSPQGLNFLFYLVVLASVLAGWRPLKVWADGPSGIAWRARLTRARETWTWSRWKGDGAEATWGHTTTLVVLLLLGLICLASAMSHQLTPYALIVALVVCVGTRRLGRPELAVLAVVFTVGWLSLGASNYWVGHLNEIFGSFFQFGSTIDSNVTSRLTGSSSHIDVVYARILLTVGVFILAGVGAIRRRTDSRALEVLAISPFLLLFAQSYGGEALMRFFLYALPFASILAASAFLPRQHGEINTVMPKIDWAKFAPTIERGKLMPKIARIFRRLRRLLVPVLIFVVLLASAIAMTVVRGGNDAYVSFSTGELAAVNYVYNHVKPGEDIGSPVYYLPIGQRGVGTVLTYVPETFTTYKQLGKKLLNDRPTFIILSQSEEAFGEDGLGFPVGWEGVLETSFLHNGYGIAAQWPTATVLELRG